MSARKRRIVADSVSRKSPSSSTGTWWLGLIALNAAPYCSPAARSMI